MSDHSPFTLHGHVLLFFHDGANSQLAHDEALDHVLRARWLVHGHEVPCPVHRHVRQAPVGADVARDVRRRVIVGLDRAGRRDLAGRFWSAERASVFVS
jgi:hypothetical protein